MIVAIGIAFGLVVIVALAFAADGLCRRSLHAGDHGHGEARHHKHEPESPISAGERVAAYVKPDAEVEETLSSARPT